MVDTTVTKAPNYTDEMTASVMEQYSNGVDLDTIADSVGKTYVSRSVGRAYMSPSRSKPLRSGRVLRRRNFCAKLRLLAWMSVGSRVQRKMHSLGCWASFSNYLNEGNRGVAFAPPPFFMPAW